MRGLSEGAWQPKHTTEVVVTLTRLKGIPLLGVVVTLIHLELVIVLPWAVAISILADLRAFPFVPVVAPAM